MSRPPNIDIPKDSNANSNSNYQANNVRNMHQVRSGVITDPNGDGEELTCHTPAPTVPPSPHLSIYRVAYNMADFNRKFDAVEMKVADPIEMIAHSVRPKCTPISWKKRVRTVFPWTDWLLHYNVKENLLADLIVGITVAVFQVPQSMGYCLIAHVPPVHGLYTAFFPPLVYAIFGTSRHSAVGEFMI